MVVVLSVKILPIYLSGLMHYINLWLTQYLNKDFYVQVNDNEPSYLYYSKLAGAEIVNTEVKYMTKS